MVGVTKQYLAYVDEIRSRNLELAAEYLLMAAMLIEIKSRMLLPPKKQAGARARRPARRAGAPTARIRADEDGRRPPGAAAAVWRDFEGTGLHRTKPAAALPRRACGGAAEAWRDILKRAKLVQHHKITREELSVREYMSMVLKTLQGRRFVEFEELFEPEKGSTGAGGDVIALLGWPKRR